MTAANDTAMSGQVRVHAVRIVTDGPAPLVAFYDTLLGTSTPVPGTVHGDFRRRPGCTCRSADATLSKKPYLRQRSTPPYAEGSSTSRWTTLTRMSTCSGRRATIFDEPSQPAWGARAATVADPGRRIINVFAGKYRRSDKARPERLVRVQRVVMSAFVECACKYALL